MFPPFFWIISYSHANIRNNTVKKINKTIINVQVWDLPLLMLTIAKFPCSKDQFITNIHYGSNSTVLDLCIFLSWFKKVVFLLEKVILWIKDLYFICKQWIEVQKFWIRSLQTYSLLLHKKLNDGLKLCGLLVDYCDVWVLILTAPIHCRGSIVEQVMQCWFLLICSYGETN